MLSSTSFALLPLGLLASIAEAANHVVTVGKGGQLLFDPAGLNADVGDTVTYQFFSKNHSVVQSSFDKPCQPLDGGFFSGFTPTASNDTASATTFTITVSDSKPIWAYCSQTTGTHCNKGMVHAINAKTDGSNTLQAYKDKAATVDTITSPSSPKPAGGSRVTKVDVGVDTNLKFSLDTIVEIPGTTIQFSFNPKNHSVVQSSFDKPCQPLDNGFSSGFVPTASSGLATFEIVVPDDNKPIWFYCAQTAANGHCQSGMVGSINALTTGDHTQKDFAAKAATAGPSTIPPQAPLHGTFKFNGAEVTDFQGNVFTGATNAGSPSLGGNSPPSPGTNTSSDMWDMAGGAAPNSYNWPDQITSNATDALQLLEWFDNLLLDFLWGGYGKLREDGVWKGTYPKSIVDTIGALTAQALVHRSTATDSLGHYSKSLTGTCKYKSVNTNVDEFLQTTLTLLLLQIGVIIDVSSVVAAADPWLIPILTAQVGAKSRMTAVVNMMQNHLAAAAVREVMIPAKLAYSYAYNAYIESCPDKLSNMPEDPYPALTLTPTKTNKKVTGVSIPSDLKSSQDNRYIAWIGPWGGLKFTPLTSDGYSAVPEHLFGHVWAVLVNQNSGKLKDIPGMTVAGPAMLWMGQP